MDKAALNNRESARFLSNLKKRNAETEKDAERLLSKKEISLPISIFNEHSGMLESAAVYLHDEAGLKFSEISKLLKRDYKTVWASYSKGKQKQKKWKTE